MKVAALCATYCRPLLLQEAIRCFVEQTHPDKELVIVDDSPPECRREPGYGFDGVTIVEISSRLPLGTKWNIAAHATDADVLVLWDDDDWSHPNRIALQLDALLSSDKPVSVLWQHLFWQEDQPRRYLRRREGEDRYPDGAIMFRREAWLKTPLPALNFRHWVRSVGGYTARPAGQLLVCRRHTFQSTPPGPCPLCGGRSEWRNYGGMRDYTGYVCTECDAHWQRSNSSPRSPRWIHEPHLDGWKEPWLS